MTKQSRFPVGRELPLKVHKCRALEMLSVKSRTYCFDVNQLEHVVNTDQWRTHGRCAAC